MGRRGLWVCFCLGLSLGLRVLGLWVSCSGRKVSARKVSGLKVLGLAGGLAVAVEEENREEIEDRGEEVKEDMEVPPTEVSRVGVEREGTAARVGAGGSGAGDGGPVTTWIGWIRRMEPEVEEMVMGRAVTVLPDTVNRDGCCCRRRRDGGGAGVVRSLPDSRSGPPPARPPRSISWDGSRRAAEKLDGSPTLRMSK